MMNPNTPNASNIKRQYRKGDGLHWTKNAAAQMRQYGVSETKVKKILRAPARIEEGIAHGTVGVMQPFGRPTKDGRLPYRGEIWVLYECRMQKSECRITTTNGTAQKTIIAVWRYPGRSPDRGVPDAPQ